MRVDWVEKQHFKQNTNNARCELPKVGQRPQRLTLRHLPSHPKPPSPAHSCYVSQEPATQPSAARGRKEKKSKQTSIVAARVARRQRRRCCRRPLRLLRWLESGQGLTVCLHRPTSGYRELPPTGPQRQRPGHNSAGILVLNFTEWRTDCSRNYSPAVGVCARVGLYSGHRS